MSSSPQSRSRQRNNAGRYVRQLQLLERKVAARREGTGHPDVLQLRAGIHELINEMERLQQPREGREDLLKRARTMLRELPQPTRGQRRGPPPRLTPANSPKHKEMEAIEGRVKVLEGDVGRLLNERNFRLRSGLDLAPDTEGRETALLDRIDSLDDSVRAASITPTQCETLMARLERCRASLRKRPEPRKPRQIRLVRPAKKAKSPRQRYREALEIDKRERREQGSHSVRTVRGGLPGLGKHH